MTNFINSSACHGKKPRQLLGSAYFMRNALLARMMRSRTRVRYLIAPTGFGKTLLAGTYVQVVNGYEDAFWISAQNPCFLRDLDAGFLADDIVSASKSGDIIVFDDMPAMDKRRSRLAWSMCYQLIQQGREVIVCTTPDANPFHAHVKSCVAIYPTEFLFRASEFDDLRAITLSVNPVKAPSSPSDYVPSLALRTPGSYEEFLSAHIEEVGNMRQAGITLVLLVLARGKISEVSTVLGQNISIAELSVSHLRPFITVDEFNDEFDASDYPLREVTRAFGPYIHKIAPALGFKEASTFIYKLANALLQKGLHDRAVQLLQSISLPSIRALWLRENQNTLLNRGALVAGELLYESLRGTRYWKEAGLMCASAIRRQLLGDTQAQESLQRLARRDEIPARMRVQSAAIAFIFAPQEEAQQVFNGVPTAQEQERNQDQPSAQTEELFKIIAAIQQKGSAMAPTLPLPLAVFVQAITCGLVSNEDEELLVNHIKAITASIEKNDSLDAATYLLYQTLKQSSCNIAKSDISLKAVVKAIADYEDMLELQRVAYKRIQASGTQEEATNRAAVFTHQSSGVLPHTPCVQIKLLGQFHVEVDDVPIESIGFRRSKVRLLLALLVLEKGRDLPCDILSSKMWPDSKPERARHNLYTTVSLLRRALTLPGGECPYLCVQGGCVKLNAELVSSDVADLDLLCRKLRFDELDVETFTRLLENARSLYKGDLMPNDDSPMIVAARRTWKSKLVASLTTASQRMSAIREDAIALQLAQQALDIDPSREDCYELVMQMQARLGQRPAAIDTWLSYCNYVDVELGLAPSNRVKELYTRIISD